MKLSELINELEIIKKSYGDIDAKICVNEIDIFDDLWIDAAPIIDEYDIDSEDYYCFICFWDHI